MCEIHVQKNKMDSFYQKKKGKKQNKEKKKNTFFFPKRWAFSFYFYESHLLCKDFPLQKSSQLGKS